MRLQLASLAAIGLAIAPSAARADGTISARGIYYKERATRVVQPMLDAVLEVGARGLVNAHFLVDAITSASASSGASGAEPFTENRYEAGGGYAHQLGDFKVAGEAKYSTEPDYKSFFFGVRGQAELAQKNATVGLGAGIGHDTISGGTGGGLGQVMLRCEPGAADTTSCDLTSYSVFASASQILGRNTVVGLSLDAAFLRGYQSNPYRSAVVGTGTAVGTVPEQHPTERDRTAIAAFARYYVKPTDTTLVAQYRYYRDDWKIRAHTPELRAIQQLGEIGDASLRYRFHDQTRAAYFYDERYEMAQTFVSDDVKLSKFTTHTVEAKLGMFGEAFGLEDQWAGARFEAILQYIVQQNRFGNAIVAQFALTLPLSY